jgi:Domain of unknown function (DUF4328)
MFMDIFAITVCLILLDVYTLYLLATPEAVFYFERAEDYDTALTAFDLAQFIYALICICSLICFLFTTVFFCMWLHRAHRNLPSLGAEDLKFTPGWAVGWFFIPIMNIYRPLQAVREVWRGSDPENDVSEDMKNILLNKNTLPNQWWLMIFVTGISSKMAGRALDHASTLAQYRVAEFFNLIDDIISIPLAVVTILLIKGIVDRQQSRAAVLGIGKPDPKQEWEEMQPRDEEWDDYLDRDSTSS